MKKILDLFKKTKNYSSKKTKSYTARVCMAHAKCMNAGCSECPSGE